MEGKKMCCTRCKGTHLSIIADGSDSTTGGSYLGRSNAFIASTNSRVRHSWICADCGNRFRMPDELLQEAKKNKSSAIGILIVALMFSILGLLMLFSELAILSIVMLIPAALAWALYAYFKSSATKAQTQYDEITANCWL